MQMLLSKCERTWGFSMLVAIVLTFFAVITEVSAKSAIKSAANSGFKAVSKAASKTANTISKTANDAAKAVTAPLKKAKKPVAGTCKDTSDSKKSRSSASSSSSNSESDETGVSHMLRPHMGFTGTGMRLKVPEFVIDKIVEFVKTHGQGHLSNTSRPFDLIPIIRSDNLRVFHGIFEAFNDGLDKHMITESLGAILVGCNEEYIKSVEHAAERRNFVRGINFFGVLGDFEIKPLKRAGIGALMKNVYKIFLVSDRFSSLEFKAGALQPYEEMERQGIVINVFE